MKSLRYILSGSPSRLADCLDLARRRAPVEVRVDVDAPELLGEFVSGRQLVARFTWRWADRTVCCEEVCGFDDSFAPDRAACLRRANRKLHEHLAAVGQVGIPVSGGCRFGGASISAA